MWKGGSMGLFAIGYILLGGYKLCRTMVLAIIRPLVPDRMIGFTFGMVETVKCCRNYYCTTDLRADLSA